MNHLLRASLEAAAKGHAAAYGDATPNLFAESLAEIKRLNAIETDVKTLFRFRDPENDTKGYYGNPRTTSEAIEERMRVAKRLGDAVGELPKASPVKAVA